MGNVWRVFKRDVRRLIKVPPAMVVILALLFLPSAYTWYNVIGFWNPYDNTGNLRVCVVNEDAGGQTELTGQLDVGDQIVEQLQQNTQLDWVFTDYDDAMAQVQAGQSYAAFVIPEDFTANLLTLVTGDFKKPSILYYVDEKAGPVSPKITDTGATTLDETINSMFVSTVSRTAADAIDQSLRESYDDLLTMQSTAGAKLGSAAEAVGESRAVLGQMRDATAGASDRTAQARQTLEGARGTIDEAASALSTIAELTAQLQQGLTSFTATAMPAVNQSLVAFAQMAAKANATVGASVAAIHQAEGSVDAALAQAQGIVSSNEAAIEQLQAIADATDDPAVRAQLEQAIAALQGANASAQTTVDNLKGLSADISATADAIDQASSSFNDAAQKASTEAQGYASTLFGQTLPAVSSGLAQLSHAAASLAAAVGSEQALISQAEPVLNQLDDTLSAATSALDQTDDLLLSLEDGLTEVRVDVMALSASDALKQVFGESGLNASDIADFMSAPTQLRTEELYPLNAYGAAMAPLFMNLTFWIGAFMLMVILKQEVDGEGIPNLTITQRYLGRFLLLAVIVALQAIICCAGVLAIGVQAVSVVGLFVAAVVASLAYLSIIYALSVTMQHIGKGLCIVLVFAQIPGATGLYPVEMTSPFFQAIYPLLPFTYGIDAMREAICGFYDGQYAMALGMLALFFAAFMALGIVLRPLLANVNRMTARQVRQSGLFNGESVEIPQRRYRLTQVMRALADKEEYRDAIQRRYDRFAKLYPKLIRGSVIGGVAVPLAMVVAFSLSAADKTVVLTVWLAWFVLMTVFLVVVESLRYSIARQVRLDHMSDDQLRALFRARNAMGTPDDGSTAAGKAGTPDGKLPAEGESDASNGESAAEGEADGAAEGEADEAGEGGAS